ncbi:50S ribosomal protein L11 [compost metagenome]
MILKTAKLAKGSGEPNRNKVGKLTAAQVDEIAKQKMPDLNCHTMEAAAACIRGTARSMGVEIV